MKRSVFVLLFSALCSAIIAITLGFAPTADAQPAPQCSPLVGVTVRGYLETGGGKFAGPTVDLVRQKLSRPVEMHNIRYDAQVYNADTQAAGAAHLTSYLHAKANNCPHTKFVLVGYSQGALIVGNVLDQNSIDGGAILGAVFYGDPRFNGQESFDRGTYNPGLNGFDNPRPAGALHPFGARLHSYCRVDDTVCQPGGPGGDGHTNYYEYEDDAANFLVAQIRSAG